MPQPQKCTFWENLPKIKRTYYCFLCSQTTFYNVAFKIETSWAVRVAKPILETWNASDVTGYVWFIHSWIKNLKNMQCKKE